jgi:hypothetical protein
VIDSAEEDDSSTSMPDLAISFGTARRSNSTRELVDSIFHTLVSALTPPAASLSIVEFQRTKRIVVLGSTLLSFVEADVGESEGSRFPLLQSIVKDYLPRLIAGLSTPEPSTSLKAAGTMADERKLEVVMEIIAEALVKARMIEMEMIREDEHSICSVLFTLLAKRLIVSRKAYGVGAMMAQLKTNASLVKLFPKLNELH